MNVDWVLAIITLAAVLVAIFQDHIKRLFWKPKIVLELHDGPPDCQKIPIFKYANPGLIQSSESCYFRLRVKNNGTTSAEHVEIQASRLYKYNGETFTLVNNFVPMNFVFSHTHERCLQNISPNMEKFCDFFHIIDPNNHQSFYPIEHDKPIINFDLEVMPTNLGNLILEAGQYKLDIIAGASNIIKPIKSSIYIDFSGKWNDDEKQMLNKEIILKMKKCK